MEEYWIALRDVHGVGDVTARRLVDRFGDPKAVFDAGPERWRTVERITESAIAALRKGPGLADAKRRLDRMRRFGARLIPWTSKDYPARLRQIPDPPFLLTAKGNLLPDEKAVAIVGSRNASTYGLRIAATLAEGLVRAGFTVVSGFAMGIDSAAHRSALAAGGRTIAVLGCGIDVDYPGKNRELKEQVWSSGAVLSEFPLGTEPAPENFPRRNRIISGLSTGVVVVEAGTKSGSLITARMALEQNREVFAVPGQADSTRSAGCHRLIQQGAKLTVDVNDILEEIGGVIEPEPAGSAPEARSAADLDEEERTVLSICGADAVHVDDIARSSGIDVSKLAEILLNLELKGMVLALPGTRYRRKAVH